MEKLKFHLLQRVRVVGRTGRAEKIEGVIVQIQEDCAFSLPYRIKADNYNQLLWFPEHRLRAVHD